MKKWIIRLVIAGVALVVVALVIVFLSLNTIVKKGVEVIGPQIVKVDVKLGSADISPFSGSGRLVNLVVGNPPGYNTPSSIKVGDIKVAVAISSIRSDTIKIDSIDIQSPEITFEGGLSGVNLLDIKKNLASPAAETGTATGGKTSATSGKKFYVKDIVIDGGKINLAVKGLGGKGLTVPLPDIHLQNIGSENNGVTAQQLVTQVLEPILTSAYEAGLKQVGNLGGSVENLGKGAAGQLNKVGQGLKGLFH